MALSFFILLLRAFVGVGFSDKAGDVLDELDSGPFACEEDCFDFSREVGCAVEDTSEDDLDDVCTFCDSVEFVGKQEGTSAVGSSSVGIGVVVGKCAKLSSLMMSFQSLVAPSDSSMARVLACRAASIACSQYCCSSKVESLSWATSTSSIHLSSSASASSPKASWRSISLKSFALDAKTSAPFVR